MYDEIPLRKVITICNTMYVLVAICGYSLRAWLHSVYWVATLRYLVGAWP